MPLEYGLYTPYCDMIHDPYAANQGPITESVNQKFRLFSALSIRITRRIGPLFRKHGLPIDALQTIQFMKPIGNFWNTMAIGKHEFCPAVPDIFHVRHNIDQRLLAFCVCFQTSCSGFIVETPPFSRTSNIGERYPK